MYTAVFQLYNKIN